MKTLSKLSFIIILLISSPASHAGNPFYSLLHSFRVTNFHAGALVAPLISLILATRNTYQFQKLPDAPEIIANFCHAKCNAQGLNQEIQIKVKKDASFLEAFGRTYIIIGSESAEELQKALQTPSDENSINIIRIYSTFIDHEIAHLKNHDGPTKRIAILTAASLLTYAASSCLVYSSRLNYLFKKPTNIKEMIVSGCAYGAIDLGSAIATKLLYGVYAQQQEARADEYAISQATDPEALRYAAKFLEMNDDSFIEYLHNGNAHPSIPMMIRVSMYYIRGAAMKKYQMEKPAEDFRSWIKKQYSILAALKFVVDIEHPSGFSRAQAMRIAADALEAQV